MVFFLDSNRTETRRTCRLKRHRRNGKAPCGAIFAQLALVNRLLLGRKCEPNSKHSFEDRRDSSFLAPRKKSPSQLTCRLDGYRRSGKVHCVNYFCRAVSLQAERASFVRNANPICASTKTCLCACLSKTKTRRTCRLDGYRINGKAPAELFSSALLLASRQRA